GAGLIYDRILEPYLVAHEDKLDGYFRQARAVAQKSTSSASKTAYDKWVGYMQRAINQHSTDIDSSSSTSHGSSASSGQAAGSTSDSNSRISSGYTGLTSILRSVTQSVPHQASTAAGYLAGLSGISEGPQTRADTVGKPTFSTMLTSWVTAFSSTSLTEISDDQRLRDIRSRKTQLQDMVAQLENSEQAIVSRNTAANIPPPQPFERGQQKRPSNASHHNETASEFEDDAVMVGGEASVEGSGSSNSSGSDKRSQEKPTNSDIVDDKKPEEKKTPSSSRRWFW
ncbi:hypothetical protein J3B02_005662, partial [Coemansia erecta]